MAESRRPYRLALLLLLGAGGIALLLWLSTTPDPSAQQTPVDTGSQTADLSNKPSENAITTNPSGTIVNQENDEKALDCSGDFEALIGQYRPELAARLKRLDAQRRFIESSGPFIGAFGELSKLSYPGYESYDADTLLRLGDNGDQIAKVIYAARQFNAEQMQNDSDSDSFDTKQFDQNFKRLQEALEAGQPGALYLSHYVLKLRALWSSKRLQHNMPLSNRAAVIEAQAWQLATASAGTLAERVIAQHFGDALDKGSFQLLNDEERRQLKQRSEELLAGPLRNLQHPISDDERQTEAALRELFAVIEDPALATLSCRDGRSLRSAISETFIDD